ncbi:MAG: dolichol kinase [Ignavibacteria bacterium]|nr:dolichol kinase [Ignavibacteria bacterium]
MLIIKEINEKFEPIEKYDDVPYSVEVWRKLFHMVSILIPTIYLFVTKEFAIVVLSILTIIAIYIDIKIKSENIVKKFIMKIFGKLFRKFERQNFVFNGATWVLISATINVILFPKILTITSFYVLVFSDAVAALVGKRIGRIRFLNKTFEGFIAFVLVGFLTVFVIWLILKAPISFLILGFIGVIIAGVVEASSAWLRIDDNLGIPLSISLVMYFGAILATSFGQNFLNIL